MRVLVLLKSFNYPPRNGGDQAVCSAIAKMASCTDYHLISTDGTQSGRETIESFKKDFPSIPATIYPINEKLLYQKIYDKALRISNFINNRNGNRLSVNLRRIHYDARIDYNNEFYRFLNEYVVTNSIDVVQGEFQFTLGWLKGIVAPCKKVFVHHELQYVVNYQRLMQHNHTDDDLWFYKQQKQQEINALNACDAIITLSEDDANKLRSEGVHTPIFPSFAQIKLHNVEINYPVNIKKRLVFIGPETHEPNRQGMQWFLEKVWSRVLSHEPSTELAVIGKWTDFTKESWCSRYKNVQFLGFVDDLVSAIKESILIVPLFQGSGIRMKILEACNIGIPFVATTIGAEGLGFTDEVDSFIEDEPEEFANKVLRLIQETDLANEFIEKSVTHIRTNFSNERFVSTRTKCYEYLLSNH